MVGPTYKASSFEFEFPKGFPLVPNISRAVLKVVEGEVMNNITRKWFGNETDCPEQDGMAITSDSLTIDSFKGLFLIAGVSAGSALLLFFLIFRYPNREILATNDSIGQKLSAMAKVFDEEKDNSNSKSENPSEGNEGQTSTLFTASEATLKYCPTYLCKAQKSEFLTASPDVEGLSTTESGTLVDQNIIGTIDESLNRTLEDIVQR